MTETYFSLEEGKELEREEGKGSEAGLDDPGELTAACEDFHLHKTTLALPCHPGSSVWQVARNLSQQHQDSACWAVYIVVFPNLVAVITD